MSQRGATIVVLRETVIWSTGRWHTGCRVETHMYHMPLPSTLPSRETPCKWAGRQNSVASVATPVRGGPA